MSDREVANGDTMAVRALDGLTLETGPSKCTFSFDSVFLPGSQDEIFEDCRDLVHSAADGHNVTIFAYGQTGAGKTFTMYGTPQEEGITPRIATELFRIVDTMRTYSTVSVTASMVELYNNSICDLLQDARTRSFARSASQTPLTPRRPSKGASSTLRMRQGGACGDVQVEHVVEREVQDEIELKVLLNQGIAQRSVSAHRLNAESSRSHLITTIKIMAVNSATEEVVRGKILLCDLAGSERLKKTDSQGQRQKEAIEINRSLTALGDVIEAISRGQQQVPYRNHKLTQLMQDSLGGTAKTLLLVNCSPASSNLHETVMSLKYAARAKCINNGAGQSSGIPNSSCSPARNRSRSNSLGRQARASSLTSTKGKGKQLFRRRSLGQPA
eukprot:gnl/TRDRNA2_/TRDRNA2_155542_c0_seq1.p1 gnl/TRDRNA2_/TRDRNA2_155542_c0~~gnl/TRDRNA2_/TRDRNA2_155542_c0_seq1.p1  ORF type:complete len:386 (-),score=49.24 gnl/TRDRNA2_/TRDRNA2_155542_c0_seq1:266-1423(-)